MHLRRRHRIRRRPSKHSQTFSEPPSHLSPEVKFDKPWAVAPTKGTCRRRALESPGRAHPPVPGGPGRMAQGSLKEGSMGSGSRDPGNQVEPSHDQPYRGVGLRRLRDTARSNRVEIIPSQALIAEAADPNACSILEPKWHGTEKLVSSMVSDEPTAHAVRGYVAHGRFHHHIRQLRTCPKLTWSG